MQRLLLNLVLIGALTSASVSANMPNLTFSGYGSLVFGRTFGKVADPINIGQTRDAIFTADFYDVGQYDNDISFKPESIFALQVTTDISDKLSATAQLVAKGVDDFAPEFDWYYLSYQATDKLKILAGRRNIPMYYFSEYSEVGYAYPWMRPPANLYWWQITQFNSIQALYDFELGDFSNTITFFYGNEKSYDNVEMKFYNRLYGGNARQVNEFWTNIMGINWRLSGENFDLRFVYFQNDRDRETIEADGSIAPYTPFTQQFLGLGGQIDWAPFTILFDWNYVKYDDANGTVYPTYLVSVVYTIDKYQPYIVYSKADHYRLNRVVKRDYEEHYTMGYGVRYNFTNKASLKVQYDHFEDQGDPATGWNFHGDSNVLTVGVDFIF